MSITDELRKWKGNIQTYLSSEVVLQLRCELAAIADRIDAEHERAMADAELAAAPTEAQLEELGYIKGPVDADGVPIRIGDVVYDCNESPSEKFSVAIMELNKWGWLLLDSYGERNEPGQCHHYHASTVEDALWEFHERMTELGTTDQCVGVERADAVEVLLRERAELVAEYAAKLRLAGDGE